eukprot:6487776-Amphidinium_carterae.2
MVGTGSLVERNCFQIVGDPLCEEVRTSAAGLKRKLADPYISDKCGLREGGAKLAPSPAGAPFSTSCRKQTLGWPPSTKQAKETDRFGNNQPPEEPLHATTSQNSTKHSSSDCMPLENVPTAPSPSHLWPTAQGSLLRTARHSGSMCLQTSLPATPSPDHTMQIVQFLGPSTLIAISEHPCCCHRPCANR